MTKKRIIAALYRLGEMLTASIVMSALVCTLCVSGPMPVGSTQRDVTLAVLPAIYIVWNIVMLRRCYCILRSNEVYYIVNLCANSLLALVSICALFTFPRRLYSWAFLVTYFAGFLNVGISALVSVSLFHIIMLASIFLAPIGMGWVLEKEAEERQYIEKMPPMLEINPVEQDSDNTKVPENENKA